jgi:hypothetical protein
MMEVPRAKVKSELLHRVAFFSRYEASQNGSERVQWPHLLLGLLREATPLAENFLGSTEAVNGLRRDIEKSIPLPGPKRSASCDFPMDPDVISLLEFADKQTRPERRQGPLEALFASMVKSKPEWFSQYGLDADALEASFRYPGLDFPAMVPEAPPVVRLEFQGVLASLEAKLRPMPEPRAEEPLRDGRSRKQWIGNLIDAASNQHQICVRALAGQENEMSFPDYDPAAWAEVSGYRDMPWSVLMDLCIAYNRLIYGLLNRTPDEKLERALCRVGIKPPQRLSDLFSQYVAWLRDQTMNCPE